MRLLDLFCGAGGAAMGYHRAGFEVVGVDIKPQKHYPFEFHQADAFNYLRDHGQEFDVIHASPPCQAYSISTKIKGTSGNHQDLIPRLRRHLQRYPFWIIENVAGAPLLYPVMLCGASFGLKVYRHRYFESPRLLWQPAHFPHRDKWPIRTGNKELSANGFVTVAGHHSHTKRAQEAMGIDWMGQLELSQAIPPAYTEWIGKRLMEALNEGIQGS